jgi:tetratricopeptide (TPR) repeat protein
MKATEDGIKVASDYIKLIRQELTDKSVSIIFGQLFLQMGNYPMAQKYFIELLKNSNSNDPDYPNICYHLALTDGYQGNLHEAEDRLRQVFQCHISRKSNNLHLARTKNALGWIYHYSGELNEAITYYEEALVFAEDYIGLNHLINAQTCGLPGDGIGLNHLINAQTCSLLGDCYLEKHQLDEAQMLYKKALEIESLHLPSNHPRIGVTHNDLGNVFRKRKDMKKALEYYERAESIFHQSLPSHHPSTAYCWSCMAFVYLYNGEIEKAQEYHEKALKIYRRVLPADHINIKISEKNSKCTDFKKINDTYVKICAQV